MESFLGRCIFHPLRRYGARLAERAEQSDMWSRRYVVVEVMLWPWQVVALLFLLPSLAIPTGVVHSALVALAAILWACGIAAAMTFAFLGIRADRRRFLETGSAEIHTFVGPPAPDPWLTRPHWPRQIKQDRPASD